jgi:two-component system LytT family sensor kinase
MLNYFKTPASIFWILLYSVFFLQLFTQTSLIEAVLFPFCLVISIYPLTIYLSRNLLPIAILKKNTTLFLIQFFLFSAVIGFIYFAYVWLFSYLENQHIFTHSEYFNLDSPPFYFYNVFFAAGIIINICICSLEFYLESVRLNSSLLAAQLQTLQQQITPHFMFNILNHIHILMQTDVDMASALLLKYSDILRYQLYIANRQNVNLTQDLQFLKDFAEIEQVRWGDTLKVMAIWKVEKGNVEIPVLLFIPFIENAFKHVSKSLKHNFINVNFEQRGSVLSLQVENSKSSVSLKKPEASGLGLKNIKERLEILFHDNYSLKTMDTDGIYRIELMIKLK